jgi:hypothetical protein
MEYISLEQRMAKSYVDLFPKFLADGDAPITISEQEEFYLIMKNLYQLGFDEPLLFVPSLNEDDVYPNGLKKSYDKPQLAVNMKKFIKSMDSLLNNMFIAGQNLVPKIDKRQQIILSRLGINDLTKLPPAWTWMATRSESNIIKFSRCFFKDDYPYQSDFYAPFFGESSFRKLEKRLITQGYKRYDIYDINKWHCILSLTYANQLWNKELPKGGFEYKIKHTGISAIYDPYFKNPAIFGLCIPNGLKVFLEAFELMDKNLQGFIVKQTKKCNTCRYCVQTDKKGSRPFAYITVNYDKKNYNLCPYFPGYSYCWTSINNDLADQIIEFILFMDKFAKKSI